MIHTSAPIVFLDSGKGGLPYLMNYRKQNCAHKLIYIADTASFPYGTKDSTQLCQILDSTVERIIARFSPALIVLACNTASVTALKWLRRRFQTPFVGVVPAIKPASAHNTTGAIGLLVTERTAAGNYIHDLIGQFAADDSVVIVAAGDIVQYIEAKAHTLTVTPSPEIDVILNNALDEFSHNSVTTLVLGCTHFVYLIELLQQKTGKKITVIDSRTGVTKRIQEITKNMYLTKTQTSQISSVDCYSTTDIISYSFTKLLTHCNIRYSGIL